MPKNNPIEFTGKVLNQRNQLSGPDDPGKERVSGTTEECFYSGLN
ncbi:hypothetical protein QFZ28_005194 [Neobacillus niacini]|nr:hypothetical protein [Neobacillus niacini]MDQ1004654.1 hypothetical protein [Neobacillus niacini]